MQTTAFSPCFVWSRLVWTASDLKALGSEVRGEGVRKMGDSVLA